MSESRTWSRSSTSVSKRVRMQNCDVTGSVNWSFSTMLPPTPMIAVEVARTMPG